MNSNGFIRLRRTLALPVRVLVSVVVLASCGTLAAARPTPPPATSITVQLSYIPTIEYAGFYVAEDQGYYAEQALAVTLTAGGEDAQKNYIDPVDVVMHNKADFGIINGSVLLQARAHQAPLVAIASIYQHNPLGFTSLAAKHITTPRDLIGKTIQLSPDSALILRAMLTAQGIDPALVKTEPRSDFTAAPLLTGQADVLDTFITNELVTCKLQGVAVNNILPTEYGIEQYPNVIFTTEQMIREHPDLVERFLRATLRGVQYAVANPQPVSALSVKRNPSLELKNETEAMFQSVPLLSPSGSQPGMMTTATWDSTYRMLRSQGVIPQSLALEDAYTLRFLDAIYRQ